MAAAPPRVPPIEPGDWTDETRAALEKWQPPLNFHKTMAHNPRTLANWIGFGQAILWDNLLSRRERELAILRVAAQIRCDYEWGAHKRFTLAEGLASEAEVARLASPIDPAEWSPFEAALIAATDDLLRDGGIGDTAWAGLAERFTPAHYIDLIYLVGEFVMVGMMMKSFRIELDEGFERLPG
ncbi:carboxymuconolactone decarboxylase family protein [Sphingomonas profundi]|uniref:carboxymuconolactone decarboxylase family protein n=1 Tax=Alterirhizorhabdus profundi TaxID=2681549 RepID=UPI0012E74985|nr:carboxymuconolactone decarboxylase family protein [Sphingomonas profundi]